MRTFMAVLLLSATAAAEVTTSATEFTIEGKTYLKEYVWDSTSGASTETLYVKDGSGAWTLVASLYSDIDGNWTGLIGDKPYADQWDDAVQDWVVVVGADTWPTWTDFDAALTALHFWDDGGVIYNLTLTDGFVIDGITLYALASDSVLEEAVPSSPARPGQQGLLLALSKAPNAKARVTLLTALTNPTPKSVFPALAKSGNRSPRSKAPK